MATNTLKKTAADWRWWLLVGGAVVGAALWLAFLRDVLRGPLPSIPLNASTTALLIFVAGTVLLLIGARIWLTRIDHHALLRADERLQNKDALVIGAFFTVVMLFGFCITGATAAWRFPDRAGEAVTLALGWALASASVGGAFGFLLGHPRRLASDEKGKEERTTLGGLLRTGLDDMVDWLVKGLTTVLLVNSAAILAHLHTLSSGFAKGLLPPASPEADVVAAQSFAQPVIVFFTIFGALAACLVTRTYLTGALGRADRSSTGAFNRIGLEVGEVLMLQAAQRSLATREVEPSPEIANVASKLAALSITDMRAPQEFALWAKANSMVGNISQALKGYEKAVRQAESDPALLLDYGVALHMAGNSNAALDRLEQAYEHLSCATSAVTRKNVVKSLTFQLLYHPSGFDRVIALITEYFNRPGVEESGGLWINLACAWGQKFQAEAVKSNLLERNNAGEFIKPLKLLLDSDRNAWPAELKIAYEESLAAVQKAVKRDSRWKEHLRLLLRSDHPDKAKQPEMTDLEVFERSADFRRELDLPPYSDALHGAPLFPHLSAVTGQPIGTGTGGEGMPRPPATNVENQEARPEPIDAGTLNAPQS